MDKQGNPHFSVNVIGPNQSAHRCPDCLPASLHRACHLPEHVLSCVRLFRVAFGMVGHEDAKQTEYALRIVRAHCLDVLALYSHKG